MAALTKVALLGKGLLGSTVLPALVDAGFEVTVFGRSEKNKENLPAGAGFKVVDYDSLDNLQAALGGQDVVVSTVGLLAVSGQKLIIDAAIKAGVKRFIPSDFGSLSTDPGAAHLFHNISLVEIQNYLKSKEDSIEWTIFSIGAFTEFLVSFGVAFDWENKTAEIWGDGNSRISTTSLAGTAKAIVGALKNSEATKNRVLFLHELSVTQSQLLTLAQKYSPGADWKITRIDEPAEEVKKLEALVQQKPEGPNIHAFVKATLLSGEFPTYYERIDNNVVQLGLHTEHELDAKFAAVYK